MISDRYATCYRLSVGALYRRSWIQKSASILSDDGKQIMNASIEFKSTTHKNMQVCSLGVVSRREEEI